MMHLLVLKVLATPAYCFYLTLYLGKHYHNINNDSYAIKHIDRMYRDEFLLYRHLSMENERLQKRLSAIELMKQGKLVSQ